VSAAALGKCCFSLARIAGAPARYKHKDLDISMIQAVIFDFSQTLVDSTNGFITSEKMAKEVIYSSLFPNDSEDNWQVFLSTYRRMRKEFHARSVFSRARLWTEVFKHFSRTPDPERIERWETDYWTQVKAMTSTFPETFEVLESLRDTYKLAMITNTQGQKMPGGHRISLFPDLESYFDPIIVAGESGIPPKPHPEVFRLCLEKLDLKPSQAVFVGDDWRIDICGARDAGLHQVWLKHRAIKRNWPKADTPVIEITDLTQLPGQITKISD
jgi:HAD superfamily hydrolase (TIGR01549 family)